MDLMDLDWIWIGLEAKTWTGSGSGVDPVQIQSTAITGSKIPLGMLLSMLRGINGYNDFKSRVFSLEDMWLHRLKQRRQGVNVRGLDLESTTFAKTTSPVDCSVKGRRSRADDPILATPPKAEMGRLLAQIFGTADGYRRCQESVIGPWARRIRLVWRWSQFRFETKFTTPEIVLYDASIKADEEPSRPLSIRQRPVRGVIGLNAKNLPPEVYGSVHLSDEKSGLEEYSGDTVTWISFLRQLHRQQKSTVARKSQKSLEPTTTSRNENIHQYEITNIGVIYPLMCPFMPSLDSALNLMAHPGLTNINLSAFLFWECRETLLNGLEQHVWQNEEGKRLLRPILFRLQELEKKYRDDFYCKRWDNAISLPIFVDTGVKLRYLQELREIHDWTTNFFDTCNNDNHIPYLDLVAACLVLSQRSKKRGHKDRESRLKARVS
ncbi:hypothetical protein M501DRAFT_991894 [Patellaria atrata CBS 101060]|uniref:Uncharacterized protein n=1 Tax=Patellaria atrata CBS 101060 TaxID=1346257 RepID=A0A9P4SDN3_9PEZI|nr:hypothetical protein M501DRAFT_991894 [Patellaria atrata CBS 101060]